MQPGYPSHSQNPMQPMPNPPAAPQYPPQGYQPPAPPNQYSQPQPVMNDIAPPQSYTQPQPLYPSQSPVSTNPHTTRITPAPPRPMSDFTPPAPAPAASPFPQNPMQPMPNPPAAPQYPPQGYQPPAPSSRPQVVQNIPVQMHPPASAAPSSPQPYSPPQQRPQNPFNYSGSQSPAGSNYSDNRMDDILKDVNRNVSRPEQKQAKKNLPEITDKLKLSKLKKHTQKAVSHPKPMMVVVLAVITFLSLSTAAFLAFNKDSSAGPSGPEVKLVGTTAAAGDSIQAAGGSLVSRQEVDDLSGILKKQVDGFNDSQDFNQEPLSDQALGL